jgi:3-oxoacyl-[acyl-carrier protein] reductase
MSGEFRPKGVLVTGGGSGIGRATAVLFGREQANVGVVDCDAAGSAESAALVEQAGGRAIAIPADVSSSADVRRAVETMIQEFGRIDVLFSNAAIQINGPLEHTTEKDWNRMMEVNLTGAFLCCREVIPAMRRQRHGCIVISSSGHAFQSYPGYSAYAATKGGLLAFMRAAALDYAADGIRVNCVIPGATDTPLLRYHFQRCPEDEQRLLTTIPLRRLATPEDIAKAVRMLASDDASYITGTWLVVDGGLLARG